LKLEKLLLEPADSARDRITGLLLRKRLWLGGRCAAVGRVSLSKAVGGSEAKGRERREKSADYAPPPAPWNNR
jgi:hypothetical protein